MTRMGMKTMKYRGIYGFKDGYEKWLMGIHGYSYMFGKPSNVEIIWDYVGLYGIISGI